MSKPTYRTAKKSSLTWHTYTHFYLSSFWFRFQRIKIGILIDLKVQKTPQQFSMCPSKIFIYLLTLYQSAFKKLVKIIKLSSGTYYCHNSIFLLGMLQTVKTGQGHYCQSLGTKNISHCVFYLLQKFFGQKKLRLLFYS